MKYIVSLCVFLLSCLLLGEAAESTKKPKEKIAFECDPEETYMRNDCEYCHCKLEDSKVEWTCYKDGNCNNDANEVLKKCKVGDDSENSCNHCWCLADQGTICTAQLCYTKK